MITDARVRPPKFQVGDNGYYQHKEASMLFRFDILDVRRRGGEDPGYDCELDGGFFRTWVPESHLYSLSELVAHKLREKP